MEAAREPSNVRSQLNRILEQANRVNGVLTSVAETFNGPGPTDSSVSKAPQTIEELLNSIENVINDAGNQVDYILRRL